MGLAEVRTASNGVTSMPSAEPKVIQLSSPPPPPMSPPGAKTSPVPVSTSPARSGSSLRRPTAQRIPKYIAGLSALRALGRSMVHTAIGPCRSNRRYGVPSQSPSGGRGVLCGVCATGLLSGRRRRGCVAPRRRNCSSYGIGGAGRLYVRQRGRLGGDGRVGEDRGEFCLQGRRGVPNWLVAEPAERREVRLFAFVGPEAAWPDLSAGVELHGLMWCVFENPADGMTLRAFEFQHANTLLIADHYSSSSRCQCRIWASLRHRRCRWRNMTRTKARVSRPCRPSSVSISSV